MRFDSGVKLRKVGTKYMIVKSCGDNVNMTDVITLNETAAVIWEHFLGQDFTVDDVVSYLTGIYEIDPVTARADSEALFGHWRDYGILSD